LDEAEQAASFLRSCEEAAQWIDNTEPKIKSQEQGKDFQATQNLLDQHKAMADDFKAQESKIAALEHKAKALKDAKNFKTDELDERSEDIRKRYDELAPVIKDRGVVLKSSLADFELLQDINEQRTICAEQQTLLGSDFKPKDIVSAEAALSKNANLKNEVLSANNKVDHLSTEAEKRLDEKTLIRPVNEKFSSRIGKNLLI
jgi:spectrin alpha